MTQTPEIMTPGDLLPRGRHHNNVQLGADLARAGLNPTDIAALMIKIDQRVRDTVHDMIPELIALSQRAYVAACQEIERRIAMQNLGGVVGRTLHGNCTLIARQVASETPRFFSQ